MVAQEWAGHHLQSNIYFEPDEQGLDLFSAYLRSFHNQPIRLLVDLIEEEFRQIKIPLLRGSDRQAIIKRNYQLGFMESYDTYKEIILEISIDLYLSWQLRHVEYAQSGQTDVYLSYA